MEQFRIYLKTEVKWFWCLQRKLVCYFQGRLEGEQGNAGASDSDKKYQNNILDLRDMKWKLAWTTKLETLIEA